MTTDRVSRLAADLLRTNRQPEARTSGTAFADISIEEAMAIQASVLRGLGETVTASKVATPPSGPALAAPIIASRVVASGGTLALPSHGFMGLEVEIAVRLKHDLTPELAAGGEQAVLSAIDYYLVGIELIGTRLDDRAAAGPYGPLADAMITNGYVYADTQRWTGGPDVDGTAIEVSVDGRNIYSGKAAHPFGGVLKPLHAYALASIDHFGALKAGMIVTTGTLCGLVEVPGGGAITARVGGTNEVSVTLV